MKSRSNAYTNRTVNAHGGTLSRGGHNEQKILLVLAMGLRPLDGCGIESYGSTATTPRVSSVVIALHDASSDACVIGMTFLCSGGKICQ